MFRSHLFYFVSLRVLRVVVVKPLCHGQAPGGFADDSVQLGGEVLVGDGLGEEAVGVQALGLAAVFAGATKCAHHAPLGFAARLSPNALSCAFMRVSRASSEPSIGQ